MTSKIFGRLGLALGAILLVSLFAWEACSDEINVIQVHRSIPLSDDEPVYRDIYISGGSDSGIKNNLVVQVLRKTIIKDATGSQSYGEMLIPAGQIRVIYVGSKISVAREFKSPNQDSIPALDQLGVQVGDKIELKGSYVDIRKPAPTTAAVAPLPPTIVVAPVPAVAPAPIAPVTADASNTREPSAEPAKEVSE